MSWTENREGTWEQMEMYQTNAVRGYNIPDQLD